MARPDLTPRLKAEEFLDHYWLRQELVAFCRLHGGPTTGAKLALTGRIASFLRQGAWAVEPTTRRPRGAMPATLTLETVIGPGWTCSQTLRAFLEQELGPSFRFDQTMRSFIASEPGRTLHDAIESWRAARATAGRKPIEPQFEYNRFTRAFRDAHPGASHAEVVRAWREHRQTPRSRRSAP